MTTRSHAVEDILDRLAQEGRDDDRATVGDVIGALGGRGFGPFLFVPALIEVSPIGGVPGVPTLLALIIALFAVQIVMGRDEMWLPGFLERRSVQGDNLLAAADKLRGIGRWLDRWFHGRLEALTGPKASRIAGIAVLLLCLTVPPLELVPFASTAPMAAIAAFGLAMTLRDGVLMGLGFALSVVAAGVGLGMIGGG
ncbi:exopolysaccharide biosynthesis protein [Limimaricola hongkongensis]|uniref:Exopolysaccharide synthesis, ExoD n=1 Tax=Limimaricola hongkongensis DSM 17492 TaxID=1122180 RepID=A0A017HE92_9RHOB|nr:exopolysaccharide biosynthesis protein [Limimaricola hongkongensis]EYD72468.1 Exopolysaccharide synthesis, ExoD [Limimaricola hongkongensis DSM 17492]